MTVSLVFALARGALTSPFKRNLDTGAPLPRTRLVRTGVRVDARRLAAYARLCGYQETDPLPLPYPHLLGFPLAARVMADRSFPLPMLGLVHTRIEIASHQALRPDDALELTVFAEELLRRRRGVEVTMTTQARRDGELVWESRSGYLARRPTTAAPRTDRDAPPADGDATPAPRTDRDATPPASAPAADRDATPDPPANHHATPAPAARALPAVAEWRLPADLGRRYGAASGDRNPIHLHPLTARLFGFPRPIAHGMWTLARCLAEQDGQIARVRAQFTAPVPLPATVTYAADGAAFQLRSGDRVHLTGRTSARPS
ncbi:MaoC/PaaZ C-terminal domain-containing protein [Streptomyces sp. NPDC051907]|uniref:MaoC/PaaZ C-terminal domain-containing protein n=1 Tax=Streptomyces sp. NPDC051907 TaxID=3155284 RepID=UPI0034215F0A